MGEDKFDKLHRGANRLALGDITNRKEKKGLSLVSPSPNSPSESNEGATKLYGGPSDDPFWKQVAFLLDKLKYETCGIPECPNYAPDVDLSLVKGGNRGAAGLTSDGDYPFWEKGASLVRKLKRQRCGSAKCPKVDHEDDVKLFPLKVETIHGPSGDEGSIPENGQIDIHGFASGVKEASSSALNSVDPGEGQILPNVVNEGDIAIQTCSPSLAVAESSETCVRKCLEAAKDEKTRVLSDALENDSAQRHLATKDPKDDGKILCVDYLASSRLKSGEIRRLSEPLDGKSFKLEGCTVLKVDESSSLAADPDLLKSCSCSFCTKAAYMWSDLYYQDVKGRISVRMKSQNEASNLAQRYSGKNAMGTYVLGSFSKATNLEIDLMSRWKSLFLQMESAFVDESSQLQTNFLALKDLRDDFKMSLESINGMPPCLQPCSSDASDHRII